MPVDPRGPPPPGDEQRGERPDQRARDHAQHGVAPERPRPGPPGRHAGASRARAPTRSRSPRTGRTRTRSITGSRNPRPLPTLIDQDEVVEMSQGRRYDERQRRPARASQGSWCDASIGCESLGSCSVTGAARAEDPPVDGRVEARRGRAAVRAMADPGAGPMRGEPPGWCAGLARRPPSSGRPGTACRARSEGPPAAP